MLIGLMLTNVVPSNLYAAAIEEADDVETTYVAEQAQEQPEVADATEEQSVEESATPETITEQLQGQPEYPDVDDAPAESPASTDTNDTQANTAQPETVNVEEILAQAVAQPQPRALFNRYAFGATINMQAIQQFIAEQAGHLAATLLFASTKANGLNITNIEGKSVFYTQKALLFVLRLINFSSVSNAIVASFETEATTSHEEMHAKAFKDGLPYAAASAIASFASTAINRLFYFYH